MPWNVLSKMKLRAEFSVLASEDSSNISALCRQYGISRKTGYKWLSRYQSEGTAGLAEQERRPKHSPNRTPPAIEALILAVREVNPCWGGRKIRARLSHQQHTQLPSASTITEILRRHGKISEEASQQHRAFCRFERADPNELWQIDFKGYVVYQHAQSGRSRCYPLTILDDHSRYSLCVDACGNEQRLTVQQSLIATFRKYGLPKQMTMDNGSPWGLGAEHRHTRLTVWLMHLGVRVSHSRPYHPQTQGKDERFHRTLKAELLQRFEGHSLEEYQQAFDAWRERYNTERPHQALGDQVPASRYRRSDRNYPEQLPPLVYPSDTQMRKVQQDGVIFFQGRVPVIGKAFMGYAVGLKPTATDGIFDAYFGDHWIKQINMHEAEKA